MTPRVKMMNYYDKYGNYKGRIDSCGNVYDEHSNYKGNVDSEGRFYDSHSNYRGRRIKERSKVSALDQTLSMISCLFDQIRSHVIGLLPFLGEFGLATCDLLGRIEQRPIISVIIVHL